MPRPTLEKPMPAMYWPRAMPSRPSGVFCHRAAQGLGDDLDGLQVEHVRELPGALGDVALDGVGQGVHAGGGGEALGHGGHHVGVDDGHDGDVVGVDADELAASSPRR